MRCRCYPSPPPGTTDRKEQEKEQSQSCRAENEEETSQNQPNHSIAGQMEMDSTASCCAQSLILDKEDENNNNNNNNNEIKDINHQNQLEIIEREPIANLEDGMECEDGAITFSECPDISWIGAEASDVIYTFSELG